jgi:hypothetical protein
VLDSCETFALSDEDGGALVAQAGDLAQILTLTDGSFFYSRNIDYSLRLSRRKAQRSQLKQVAFQPLARDGSQPEEAATRLSIAGPHVWNSFMLEPFFALGETLAGSERTILYEDFLLPLVRGFFGVEHVRHGPVTLEVHIISRRDWHRCRWECRCLRRGAHQTSLIVHLSRTNRDFASRPSFSFEFYRLQTLSSRRCRSCKSEGAYRVRNPKIWPRAQRPTLTTPTLDSLLD